MKEYSRSCFNISYSIIEALLYFKIAVKSVLTVLFEKWKGSIIITKNIIKIDLLFVVIILYYHGIMQS